MVNSTSKKKRVHPPKQTWNLKMDPWKRRFLLETIISRFHVNFWGCKLPSKLSLQITPDGDWGFLNTRIVPDRNLGSMVIGSMGYITYLKMGYIRVITH